LDADCHSYRILASEIENLEEGSSVLLASAGDFLYAVAWQQTGTHLWQIRKSDGDAEVIWSISGSPRELRADGEFVYWLESPASLPGIPAGFGDDHRNWRHGLPRRRTEDLLQRSRPGNVEVRLYRSRG
jgi:hypothetical protein